MSTKDYLSIATVLRGHVKRAQYLEHRVILNNELVRLASNLAYEFETSNPRFKREVFMKAAGFDQYGNVLSEVRAR